MNYSILKTLLDGEFAGQEDAAIVAEMNDKSLSRMVLVEKFKVNNYISQNNVIPRLRVLAASPPSPQMDTPITQAGGLTLRMVALAGIDFPVTDTGPLVDPANPNVQGLIGILQGEGQLSQELVDGFWELFRVHYSRADDELGEVLAEQHINIARYSEQATLFRDSIATDRQQLATKEAMLADLESGNAYHELSEVGG